MNATTRKLLVAGQVVALAALAAGPARGQERPPRTAGPHHPAAPSAPALRPVSLPGEGTTTVTVHNETDAQMALYVTGDGTDVRIGAVAAHQEQIVLLPDHVVRGARGLNLYLRPEGGVDRGDGPYPLHPGDHLFLTVPPAAPPLVHGSGDRT